MSEKKNVMLRLDPNVYDKVDKLAKQEKRSVNAQIEYMLDNSRVSVSVEDLVILFNNAKSDRR